MDLQVFARHDIHGMAVPTALTVQTTHSYLTDVTWARSVASENRRFYHYCAGARLAEAGLLTEAVREYEAAIRCEAHPEASYFGLADALCRLGRPERAAAVLAEAAQRSPGDSAIEFQLGLTHVLTGDMAGAAAAFKRCTEIRPRWARAWLDLGKANLKLHRYPEATAAYERAFALAKPSPRDRADYDTARRGAGRRL